jgi:hypothetical protein
VIAYLFAATLCGASFSLPKGWQAEITEKKEDKTRLAPDASTVYSATTVAVVARKGKHVAGMTCDSGSPAYPVDCDALIARVFKSTK